MPPNDLPSQQQVIVQSSTEAFNRWVESFEEDIRMFENTLRGKHITGYDSDGFAVWEKIGQAIMNEEGILWIGSRLRLNLNKNTYMSLVDEERVYQICRDTITAMAGTLFKQKYSYGLKPEHFYEIIVNVSNLLEMGYRRAIRGEERRRVMPLERIVRTENVEEYKNQQRSLFSSYDPKRPLG